MIINEKNNNEKTNKIISMSHNCVRKMAASTVWFGIRQLYVILRYQQFKQSPNRMG